MLGGETGEATALAMRVVVAVAEAVGARELLDVAAAHVDGCLYHGRASLDFAERLAATGGRVRVPTSLNVSSLDLLHPDRFRGDQGLASDARALMDRYVALGCRPTWTCAPYQLPELRPDPGTHVAWAESNAIVFANSVLGARTDRYGDFIDICAGLTGRAPAAGFHLDEHRRGRVVFRLRGISPALLDSDVLYPVLGHLIGASTGSLVPVIDGLPADVSEDRLKALGAAAASSGAVGMFHAVGRTPEAPTLEDALGWGSPDRVVEVTPADLRRARDELTSTDAPPAAVSLGTPHYSAAQLAALADLVGEHRPRIPLYVSTGRDVAAEARDEVARLESAGIRLVTDTCTYVTPILEVDGPVMTDSAKWAWYAPGNLGLGVLFGSVEECVRSAATGEVWRDERLWR